MNRILAVGDIHGCFRTFERLILGELRLQKSDILVCLGDLVDRGPDSKSVADLIIHLRKSGHTIYTIRGNHEELMMKSVNGPFDKSVWIANGGDKTLSSFSAADYEDLTSEYRNFFEQTLFYKVIENYIFVHAGLNLALDNPFEDQTAMLWTRQTTHTEALTGRTLIHGHTPLPIDTIFTQINSPVINIDGGCVYREKEGLGHLVGYVIPESRFYSVRNIDAD